MLSVILVVGWGRQHPFLPPDANEQCRLNSIRHLRIGDQVISDQATVGQAFAKPFQAFYHWGPANWWWWLTTNASALTPCQHQQLILPFSDDEVKVAVRGINNEGAPNRTTSQCSSTRTAGTLWDMKSWRRWRNSRSSGAR